MSYLERLKAKIAENAHPTLPTEPTKAPSVSFVSAPGCHVLNNEGALSRPEPLTQYYPCVVCGSTDRWDDHGIWRCCRCWPSGSLAQQAMPHTFLGPERSA